MLVALLSRRLAPTATARSGATRTLGRPWPRRHTATDNSPTLAPHADEQGDAMASVAASGPGSCALDARDDERTEQLDNTLLRASSHRRVALHVGYVGTHYRGLQKMPNQPTIEAELEKALSTAGLLRPDTSLGQNKWSRSGRTDKGVHSHGSVVSLRMQPAEGRSVTVEQVPALVNALLTVDVRVFSACLTSRSFDARYSCTARTYEYLLPTYALAPPAPEEEFTARGLPVGQMSRASPTDERIPLMPFSLLRPAWRLGDAQLNQTRAFLAVLLGTHSFANFTSGLSGPNDPSAVRTVLSATCSDPFLLGDREFVSIILRGPSFLRNMVRKIISAVVCLQREGREPAELASWLGHNRRHVLLNIAPSSQLVMIDSDYSGYNRQIQSREPGRHHSITLPSDSPEIQAFRQTTLFPHIASLTASNMDHFLSISQFHPVCYSDSWRSDRHQSGAKQEEKE